MAPKNQPTKDDKANSMPTLLTQLMSDKGTKSYRLVLIALMFFVWQKVELLDQIDKRLARLENRFIGRNPGELGDAAGVTGPGSVTGAESHNPTVGPEWPKNIAAALTGEKATR